VFSRNRVEVGHGERNNKNGKNKGNKTIHQGLRKKLPDQVAPGRPYYFSQTNFFRAVGRLGGGEIDKVDARQKKDKNGYSSEKPDVTDITVRDRITYPSD